MNTLNGHALIECVMTIPRVGVWVADVLVDADEAIAGAVVLNVEGLELHGAVARGGVELARWRGRIVGGAGGLASVLGPAPFADTTLATVLSETLRDAGEQLSAAVGDLTATVARWARAAAPAGHTVADVARAAGYAWRVLADGTVWVGPETWAALELGTDLDVIGANPRTGRWELAGAAALAIVPGRVVTLDGQDVRVGAVEHRLHEVVLRTVVFEERAADPANRLLAAVEGIVRRVTRETLYLALHPGRVVAQDGDGGPLDVEIDDTRLVIPRGIPYRTLAGIAITVPKGTRVLVGFEGGDPARPYASLWELGDVTSLAVAGGTHKAARQGHAVRVTIPAGTVLTAATGGVLNPDPITLDGTIREGSDELLLT